MPQNLRPASTAHCANLDTIKGLCLFYSELMDRSPITPVYHSNKKLENLARLSPEPHYNSVDPLYSIAKTISEIKLEAKLKEAHKDGRFYELLRLFSNHQPLRHIPSANTSLRHKKTIPLTTFAKEQELTSLFKGLCKNPHNTEMRARKSQQEKSKKERKANAVLERLRNKAALKACSA